MAKIDAPKPEAPADPAARQRARSIAIALGLVFLVVLFYLITIFKMGGSVLNRSM
ncbi:MAG: hypothetical protein ACRCTI_13930 [Beijerinckiaceae bacterium]